MIKEFKYLLYILLIFFFILFSLRHYFSDDNQKKTYNSINIIDKKISKFEKKLVFLKNNTENIVEYVEFDKNKKTKKYSFWELLYND